MQHLRGRKLNNFIGNEPSVCTWCVLSSVCIDHKLAGDSRGRLNVFRALLGVALEEKIVPVRGKKWVKRYHIRMKILACIIFILP